MKKTILLFASVLLLASFTASAPKPKTFTLNEEQAGKLFQAIQISMKAIPSSTGVNAAEASVAIQNLQEIQKVISEQYQAQAKLDSVKPKK